MARGTVRVEALEVRRMLIAATNGDDVIRVLLAEPSVPPRSYVVEINGQRTVETFAPNDQDLIVSVDCLAGNDSLTTDPNLPFRVAASGGDGNDTLVGGSRYDLLHGGAGDDLMFGKLGPDDLVGGPGNDTLRGGGSVDNLSGDSASGFDNANEAGADMLFGEDGNDKLIGGAGNDLLNGGAGGDVCDGNAGDDLVYGGDGDDSLSLVRGRFEAFGGAGHDTLDGGAGSNGLVVESTEAAVYVSFDGVANDGLWGQRSNVTPTFDRINAGAVAGGSVINASALPHGIKLGLESLTFIPEYTMPATFIGSNFADVLDSQFGFDGPLQIDGRGGDDDIRAGGNFHASLYGGAGNDTLIAGQADDMILGEDGDDFIEAHGGKDRVSAGVGNDTVYGDSRNPLGFENPEFYGADTVEGNAGNDVLVGGGNNDRIFGQGGTDTLIGGGGNDVMFGGPEAADLIQGGNGNDSAATDDKDTYESVEVMLV